MGWSKHPEDPSPRPRLTEASCQGTLPQEHLVLYSAERFLVAGMNSTPQRFMKTKFSALAKTMDPRSIQI